MFTFLNKQGFTPVGVLVVVLFVVLVGGVLIWQFWPVTPSSSPTPSLMTPSPIATPSPTPSPSHSPDETAEEAWSCGDTLFYQGKDYDTVKIGNQCWFAENLDYDNGCSQVIWVNDSDEGWCGYPDGRDRGEGLLYQWSAAMNGVVTEEAQGLCPDGWHIPSDSEWTTLENNVCGDAGDEGSALAGYADLWWDGHSTVGSDNDFDCSGFRVLPAGLRSAYGNGRYYDRGDTADLWSSTQNGTDAWQRSLICAFTGVYRDYSDKAYGHSVRCLKD